jgi:hypothetical protein
MRVSTDVSLTVNNNNNNNNNNNKLSGQYPIQEEIKNRLKSGNAC